MKWNKITKENGYTFWQMELPDNKKIFNATKDENIPTSEAGYFSLVQIMNMKKISWEIIEKFRTKEFISPHIWYMYQNTRKEK